MLYSGNFGLHNLIRQSSFDKYRLSTIIANPFAIDTESLDGYDYTVSIMNLFSTLAIRYSRITFLAITFSVTTSRTWAFTAVVLLAAGSSFIRWTIVTTTVMIYFFIWFAVIVCHRSNSPFTI
ncbi:hypothetical protein D3C81_1898560 [compost metagenome]